MIKISRLADYSTVIMNQMATHPEMRYSAAAIAEQTNIALPTVSKILKLLNEALLVHSTRGVNGGYELAKSAEEISVFEIIAAIDGLPAMTECSKQDYHCGHDQNCDLRSNWQVINKAIMQVLKSISLADLGRPMDKPVQFYFIEKQHLERKHAD